MQIDLAQLLGPVVMAVIGWLIRLAFKSFGDKIEGLDHKMSRMFEIQADDGNRITALETAVHGWKPRRRRASGGGGEGQDEP